MGGLASYDVAAALCCCATCVVQVMGLKLGLGCRSCHPRLETLVLAELQEPERLGGGGGPAGAEGPAQGAATVGAAAEGAAGAAGPGGGEGEGPGGVTFSLSSVFPNLVNLVIFHMEGRGLAALAGLSSLQRLTLNSEDLKDE